MNRLVIFAMAFLFIAIGGLIAAKAGEPVSSPVVIRHISGPQHYLSEVTKVVDGDTVYLKFKVWIDITLNKKIRFDDIDTWEINRGTKGEKEKGLAAKEFVAKLLKRGSVYLKTEGKTGSFGRTLGSIHVLIDGKMINVSEELRKNGHEKIKTN